MISSGSCLTLYDRKVDIQSSAVPRRLLGSPSKSGGKFEDYNDSGYDGSPLSPGNLYKKRRQAQGRIQSRAKIFSAWGHLYESLLFIF